MKKLVPLYGLIILFISSCYRNVIEIKNDNQDSLIKKVRLEVIDTKRFRLDSISPPKVQFTQLYKDTNGVRYFTFSNIFNNSIYLYDYSTMTFVRKIIYNKTGKDAIKSLEGYYIKSFDSIYIYNKIFPEAILVNDKEKILEKYSLHGKNDPNWSLKYPQYSLRTVIHFIETPGQLILPGLYAAKRSISKSKIEWFKFAARIDIKNDTVNFSYRYPKELYGLKSNWPSIASTLVYCELHPDGDKLIFSFPISHDLYIADLDSENYQTVYAGSNIAGSIRSIKKNPRNTTNEMISLHYLRQDVYTAIIHDPFRNIYYRFLLNAVPESSDYISCTEKPVTIIVLDKDFNYLGETTIGIGEIEWYWENSFVTEEGLNVQYIEKDTEDFLTLKIFAIKEI